VITYYVAGRRRLVADGTIAGALLFGFFTVGVFSCRDTAMGIGLIGSLVCLVVYLTNRAQMAWFALFFTFASLPADWHVGADIGVVTIYLYQVATVLAAIYFLRSIARLRRSDYILPGVFLATVVCFAVVGFAAGNPADIVLREFLVLCEVVSGFVLAMLIIEGGHIKAAVRAIAATLWFSAGMLVAGSFHLVRLAGRAQEELEKGIGTGEATRFVTNSQTPALVVLTALVAASIAGRVRPATYLVLAPPALVIALLSFARHILVLIGVAAIVAFITSPGWPTLRRAVVSTVVSAAILAVTIPGSLVLLKHSGPGVWLGDQLTAFDKRVLHGVSSNRMAMDPSVLARKAENVFLRHAIGEAPVFGHGLGYPYQLAFGEPGSFEETLGTTYAHNFYLWWLAKAGVVGMLAFALFALTPALRGLLSASVPAKVAAAVIVAALVNCTVDPIPEDPCDATVLGLALGAALQFAVAARRGRHQDNQDDTARPASASDVPLLPATTGTPA
jgi:hypothetical protein